MSLLRVLFCAAVACSLGEAQTAEKHPTFDVATIKPAAPPTMGGGMVRMMGPSGGPGSKDPGRINYPFVTVKNLLMIAYDVKSYQISGPPGLDSDRFEIHATMPPDTSKEDFKLMLQNLLAERFLLKLHRETKELPMYSLVVGKKGAKLKETGDAPPVDPNAPPPAFPTGPQQFKRDADGFPILPMPAGGRVGFSQIMMPNRARLTAQHQTMQDLANRLTGMLDRPVTDLTGLTGKYDFTLTYSPEGLASGMGMMGPPPPPPPGGGGRSGGDGPTNAPEYEPPPDLFSAVQMQLGLKLDAKKGSVEMLVIDHVEKTPTEN